MQEVQRKEILGAGDQVDPFRVQAMAKDHAKGKGTALKGGNPCSAVLTVRRRGAG